MRVAVLSTYPPRPCGIGTFTHDLRTALLGAAPDTAVDVLALVRDEARPIGPEVAARVRQDVRSDYAAAAGIPSWRGADVVIVEHEYGIFGGEAGSYVLSFVADLQVPLVVTLHTVLSAPSVHQAETLRALCDAATLVTVFTETARRMVTEAQLAPPERVRVVPHGGPVELLEAAAQSAARNAGAGAGATLGPAPRAALERLDGRTVLSTFGLISAGKGIETAIAALPAVVDRHPEVLYLVAGQTHPEVVKTEGERYRLSLERLVRDLDLTRHVHFVDRFLTTDDLAVLLGATDLYLTPYRSREQIVSGALTFALVAGCPVVSTPYYYAEDLLGSGAGRLVPFDDTAALAGAVLDLLDDPAALAAAREEAGRLGKAMSWPAIGELTLSVLEEAAALGSVLTQQQEHAASPSSPQVRPDHLLTLVDDVGIVQHADGVVPNRSSGYCVDDMARLVVVGIGLHRGEAASTYLRMLTLGLSFLRHAWDPARAGMHNLLAYDRHWLDRPFEADHLGRASWALGSVLAADLPSLALPARHLQEEVLPVLEASTSPRAVAFTVLGLTRGQPETLSPRHREVLRSLADRLSGWYAGVRTESWRWLEPYLSYDNARLPQAMVAAGRALGDEELLRQGLEALDWYAEQCALSSGVPRMVGHRGRRRHEPVGPGAGEEADGAEGDEQPVEAAALVEALVEAFAATGDPAYGRRAVRAFEWFLGRNRLGIAVYDFATGGCHDGLGAETVNDNEGAESTLAFLQALHALDDAGLQAALPRL